MASFQLHTDPLVQCPYNPAHRLKRSRMQIHITKCKKNHVDLDLKECPFNAQHRIHLSEYQFHISRCPDRRLVERQVVHASDESHQGKTSVPSYSVDQVPVEEYWDEIPSTRPGYDPKKKLDSGNYILIPKGQPVDRRNMYKKMFAQASEKNDWNASNEITENGNSIPAVSTVPEIKPLRLPKAKPEVFQDSMNLGRGQGSTVRRKIAANIFGGSMGGGLSGGEQVANVPQIPGGAVGLGRGVGRGRGGFPPLEPGQVQFLN